MTGSFVVAGLLMASLGGVQDRQAATLAGLTAVSVVVEPLAPAVAELGVSKDSVYNDGAAAVKAAGLTVDAAAPARITITINAVPIQTGARATRGVAFTVSVTVDQDATLSRSQAPVAATTWRRAGIGVSQLARARGAIRAQLQEYLEAFRAAYRSANPATADGLSEPARSPGTGWRKR